MKIENCPYAHYCGDKSSDNTEKQVWYCPRSGNKDWCPYDKCETPTKVVNMTKPVHITPSDLRAPFNPQCHKSNGKYKSDSPGQVLKWR